MPRIVDDPAANDEARPASSQGKSVRAGTALADPARLAENAASAPSRSLRRREESLFSNIGRLSIGVSDAAWDKRKRVAAAVSGFASGAHRARLWRAEPCEPRM